MVGHFGWNQQSVKPGLDARIACLGICILLLAGLICVRVLPARNGFSEAQTVESAEEDSAAPANEGASEDSSSATGSSAQGFSSQQNAQGSQGDAETLGIETFLEELDASTFSDSGEAVGSVRVLSASISWTEGQGLVDTASGLLEEYSNLPSAELMASGYLDIKGNVWGAIVRVDSRSVDMVTVRCDESDEESAVRVLRYEGSTETES